MKFGAAVAGLAMAWTAAAAAQPAAQAMKPRAAAKPIAATGLTASAASRTDPAQFERLGLPPRSEAKASRPALVPRPAPLGMCDGS